MTHASDFEPVSMTLYADDFAAFAETLFASFQGSGFAVVSDHGLDPDLIGRATAATKAFFALPDAVKQAYQVPGTGGTRGYTPFGVEQAKDATAVDLKEFWHTGRELPDGHRFAGVMPPNLWPAEIADFHDSISGLYAALDALGGRLLRALALKLGLPLDYFAPRVAEGNSVLRLLHYPPVLTEGMSVRAGAHEDINVITLLLGAEEAGLEVKSRDGRWLPLQPPPGALACNIGDMLQRLTNHVLPSTTHRVVNPVGERRAHARYSTPFFLHFAPDVVIETLPGCIGPDRPNRYPEPITADAYLKQRLREIKLL